MTGLAGAAALIVLMGADPRAACDVAARAPAWLPDGHWAEAVVRRWHALSASDVDPVSVLRVRSDVALLRGAEAAGSGRGVGAVADGPVARAELEGDAGLWAGGVVSRGVVRAGGFAPDSTWSGPEPEADASSPEARLWLTRLVRCRVAFTADAVATPSRLRVRQGTVDVTAGAVAFWAGRRTVGWAPGAGGGIVLGRLERFGGAGATVTVPGSSRAAPLGAWRGELFAGPVPSSGRVSRPWLLGMRVHVRPHGRVDIGASRVAVFGGMDGAGIGAGDVLRVLAGVNLAGDHADDQVASVDVRWRPPLPLPHGIELYGEWGLHDIDAEVFLDVPAFTAGVRMAALPRLERVGVAVEHTRIARSCCGNPPWYHHFDLARGWTVDGAVIGHALGGHGREWRVSADAFPAGARLVLHVTAAARHRGAENLLAPARDGRSLLLEVRADALVRGRTALDARLFMERGGGWREVRARMALRVHP